MNILIVDDHAIVRDGLRRLLATLGPGEINEAATGREAIKMARRLRLDIIILDLNLPDLGGLELLKRLLHPVFGDRISTHNLPAQLSFRD